MSKIYKDISNLEVQKNTAVENLNQIIQKERLTYYLDFFNKLKKELLENYAIKIEDDIQGFSQLYQLACVL